MVPVSVLDLSPTPEDEAFWREARAGLVRGIAHAGLVRGIESEALVRRADGASTHEEVSVPSNPSRAAAR